MTSVVQHMEQAAQENRTHYRPYIVTREYRMFGSDEQKPKSEVTAEISFVPPKSKDYRITETSGSSRGEGIVRHILDTEAKAAQTGTAPGAVTRANYDFALIGEQTLNGHDCYVLRLTPKREDKSLLDGQAWIDKTSYLLRRIDGEMAKMPSWWLKAVHVTLDFDEFDGMWLQEHTRAVADVRMIGRHILISEAVKFQAGTTEARNLAPVRLKEPKNTHTFGRGEAILGSTLIRH